MVRLRQVPFIRVAAKAALDQNQLTPGSYDGVLKWINDMEQEYVVQAEEQAIRQASAVLIRRVNRSATAIGG